jgi:hypothetical protein
VLPLLLGVLAIGMRLASFRAARLHHALYSASASNRHTR